MSNKMIGTKIVFGLQQPKPAVGFPEGKLRWRLRANDFARARISTSHGIAEFFIVDLGECWSPITEIGRNQTVKESDKIPAPKSHPLFN